MSSSGKERIPFILKGPIPVLGVGRGGGGGESGLGHLGGGSLGKSPTGGTPTQVLLAQNTGTAVLDVGFQYPCQIGELSFRNYYTAWISVLIKKLNPNNPTITTKSNNVNPTRRDNEMSPSGKYVPGLPHLETSFTMVEGNGEEASSHIITPHSRTEEEDFGEEDSVTATGMGLSRRRRRESNGGGRRSGRHLSTWSENDELERRPWEMSIEAKCLMPWPHYEGGAQDRVTIPATESLVDLRNVLLVRFVLQQPSTVWKRFSIQELNVYKHLPKRGNPNPDTQMDPSLLTLQRNTKGALWGQIVEPENNVSDEDEEDDDELTS